MEALRVYATLQRTEDIKQLFRSIALTHYVCDVMYVIKRKIVTVKQLQIVVKLTYSAVSQVQSAMGYSTTKLIGKDDIKSSKQDLGRSKSTHISLTRHTTTILRISMNKKFLLTAPLNQLKSYGYYAVWVDLPIDVFSLEMVCHQRGYLILLNKNKKPNE